MNLNDISNKQLRVFISSTFDDMQKEREHLIKKIFPTLRRYSTENNISIREVDLRWGIIKEDSEQGKIFDKCINAIKGTNIFIGILGDRYGWVPDYDEIEAIRSTGTFNKHPWVEIELEKGTSITEIEIQEGVFRTERKEFEVFFYNRSSKSNISDEDFKKQQKLKALKEKISINYKIKDFKSPEELGTLIESDFKDSVEKLFPLKILNEIEKERLEQATFLKNKTNLYVGNISNFEYIDGFVDNNNCSTLCSRGLVITSRSGLGKSALIANWIKRRQYIQKDKDNETIIWHCVGQSRSEGIYSKITAYFINEIKKEIFKDDNLNQNTDLWEIYSDNELREILHNLLDKIPLDHKLIIVLDGVDKLVNENNAKQLKWLPNTRNTRENIYFIFSTIDNNDQTMDYFSSYEYKIFNIENLDEKRIKDFISKYFISYEKELEPEKISKISKNVMYSKPLILWTLLEHLRVFGDFKKLSSEIERFVNIDNIHDFYQIVLNEIEELHKNIYVNKFFSLIAISHAGLTESELIDLLGLRKDYQKRDWDYFYNYISFYVIKINGYLTFSNNYFRDTVKKKYLSDKSHEIYLRNEIIKYFQPADDERYRIFDKLLWKLIFVYNTTSINNREYEEITWQHLKCGNYKALYDFLLDWDIFQYFYIKNKYELSIYWHSLNKKEDKYNINAFLTLDTSSIMTKKEEALLFDWLSDFTIEFEFGIDLALEFAQKALVIKENIYNNATNIEIAKSYIKVANMNLSLSEKNNFSLVSYQKALDICIQIYGVNDENTANMHFYIGKSLSLNNNSINFQSALDCLFIALSYYEELSVKKNRTLIHIYVCLSLFYLNNDDLYMFESYMNKAIEATGGKFKTEDKNNYLNYIIEFCYDVYGVNSLYAKKAYELIKKAELYNEKKYLRLINKEDYFLAIKENPANIKYISPENRTIKICSFAVEIDGFIGLKYTPNTIKTYDLCLHAVTSNGEALIWTPEIHRTRELCIKAVCNIKNKENIKRVIDIIPKHIIDESFCIEIVLKDFNINTYFSEELQKIGFVFFTMKEYENNIHDVPEEYINICLNTVRKNGELIEYVPKILRTTELYQAVEQYRIEIEKLEKENLRIQQEMARYLENIKRKGTDLRYVPDNYITVPLCLEAVKQNCEALYFVPDEHKTVQICLIAVKQNGLLLEIVPNENKTLEVILVAVKQNGEALKFVPKIRRTEEICYFAIQKSGIKVLPYVPEKIRERIKLNIG
jgi:hypothetical protein